MQSKARKLSDSELAQFEAQRDLGADLLQSISEMKAGATQVVLSPTLEARRLTGLSKAQFASLFGVSVRTIQEWESGRRKPSRAALTLLAIARRNPNVLHDLVVGEAS